MATSRQRRAVDSRLQQVEFGMPYPTFRAHQESGQVIPATSEQLIEFEEFENSHPDIFEENTSGSPAVVVSVTLHLRGVYSVQASYDWGTPAFPDNTVYWIAVNDGYDTGTELALDHYGYHQLGSEVTLHLTRGYPPFPQQPFSPSSIAEINVYAGNFDTIDHELSYANLEIFFLGALAVDTEQYQ